VRPPCRALRLFLPPHTRTALSSRALAPLALPQAVAAALASAAWRDATTPLVAAVAAGHRARTLSLLSTAYTTLSLAHAAVFLALPEPDALAGTTLPLRTAADVTDARISSSHRTAVSAAGWTQLEGPGAFLQVVPPPPPREEGKAVDLQALMAFAQHMST